MSYDAWKLQAPEHDGPPIEEIADWYGVDVDDVTDRMLSNYLHDRREYEATRWDD